MSRPDLSDIVGVAEIAEFFGVGMAAVSNWQARYDDWPEPALVLRAGRFWWFEDIAEFIANHPRLLNASFVGRERTSR